MGADGRHGLGKRILKNIAGALLILLGVVMSLPLVPGPGLVFLAVGISLTSFPGKKRFERMILRRRWVIGSINWIREKWGTPPLEPPEKPAKHGGTEGTEENENGLESGVH
jgi:hypothetical protein